jgi:hypothetical protein
VSIVQITGQTPEKVVSGRIADVICAAYFASECALKLMRPGKTVLNSLKIYNTENTSETEKVQQHTLQTQTLTEGHELKEKLFFDRIKRLLMSFKEWPMSSDASHWKEFSVIK